MPECLAPGAYLGLEQGDVGCAEQGLVQGRTTPHLLLTTQLAPELNGVTKELIMVSAYMVPGQPGLLYLTSRADAGVSISLLTNSLEATDVPAAHGGYARIAKPCWSMVCSCSNYAASPATMAAADRACFTADPPIVPTPACIARR